MNVVNTTAGTLPLHRKALLDIYDLFEADEPNYWKDLVGKEISTRQIYEEFATFSGLGPAVKVREAGGTPFDQVVVPYLMRIRVDKYVIGVEFSEEILYRDIYDKLRAPGKMMAQSHYWAKEIAAADVFNNAVTAGVTGYDGKVFAATDHNATGVSFSNKGTAEALSVGALETAMTSLKRQVSYRGQPMASRGPWKLIVAPELEITAKQILMTTQGRPGTSDHSHNVVPGQIKLVEANPYLTDTNAWALLPMGEKNPIRKMNGMPYTAKDDYDISHWTKQFATGQEYSFFWLPPYGTWYNEGA